MSIWKKSMDFLGLGPDDAYDDYDVAPEPERPVRAARAPREYDAPQRAPRHEYEPESMVRTLPTRPSFPSRDTDVTGRRPLPSNDDSSVQPRPINPPRQSSGPRLAPVGVAVAEPHTVRPRRFDSAQEIADKFKDGQPVIVNLEAADREVSRRLIDFASGVCYALNGSMEKVASGVYLLKPPPARGPYGD
jgi:cell division inhibitor SepF